MAEKKHKNYTARDIEKYHKGQLSPGEMNELEKAALDDPFLADALEGYGATNVKVQADLAELQTKLNERISRGRVIGMAVRSRSFKWWKLAAAVVIIGGLGFLTYRFATNNRNNDLAVLKSQEKKDSTSVSPSDSSKVITPGLFNPDDSIPRGTTATLSESKKNSSNESNKNSGFLKTKTDTIRDVAASSAYTPTKSLPLTDKAERNDSVEKLEGVASAGEVLAQTKKAEQNTRQPQAATAQQKEGALRERERINYFRGRVVDANNNPLPFANITNSRDNVGTYADAGGNFTLISPDSTLDVQVRSVGFESNRARLKNNVASNQVVMQEDKVSPSQVLSYKKIDTSRYRKDFVKLEEPEPADGWDNYDVYIANNLNLPAGFRGRRVDTGDVKLSFEVNQNGNPVNIRVEKSLCQKCDEEAIRLIKEGPKWRKKNKKKNRVTITVPFDSSH